MQNEGNQNNNGGQSNQSQTQTQTQLTDGQGYVADVNPYQVETKDSGSSQQSEKRDR